MWHKRVKTYQPKAKSSRPAPRYVNYHENIDNSYIDVAFEDISATKKYASILPNIDTPLKVCY